LYVTGLALLALPFLAWRSAISMPGRSYRGTLPALTAAQTVLAAELERDVQHLAGEIGERSLRRYPQLVRAAEWIETELRAAGYTPRRQHFADGDKVYWNIEAELRGSQRPDEIVLVGAHYDSAAGSPGANDNGTGVAALLALARAMHDARPARTLRFVWFANEEAPHFREPTMGSLHSAYRSKQRSDDIVAMLSLETIGYFTNAPYSQHYPLVVEPFYPKTGNFIAFVGNSASRALVRRAVQSFRRSARFPSEGAALPASVQGVGWSDQWSFWQQGYPALMVTDTAPFRYPHYHTPRDTPDRVDYAQLARVTQGIRAVVTDFAR
jgi:Zn-dependent M28 family amino/carboxypeptidase